jgi:succinate dehydrogenase / fumarate reductase membrane anchor subunit
MVNKDTGTAHNGLTDWYWQRLSAVVLLVILPLPAFLLVGAYAGSLDQLALLDILDHFFSRLVHTLLIMAIIVHAYIGLKVMLEDYVHSTMLRVPLIGAMLVVMSGFGIWWLAIIWAWGG